MNRLDDDRGVLRRRLLRVEGTLEYHLDDQRPQTVNAGDVLLVPAETARVVAETGL